MSLEVSLSSGRLILFSQVCLKPERLFQWTCYMHVSFIPLPCNFPHLRRRNYP